MKFSINREALCSALQVIGGAAASNPTMPIVNNVLMEAAGNELALTATNLDFAMGSTLCAAVEREGSATLPLRKMAGICRAIDADLLELELLPSGNTVRLSGGGSLFRLAALPVTEFPTPHAVEAPVTVNLSAAEFFTRLRLVDYAQSRDEHRQILNGIYFHLADSTLALVATDGRRLARSCQPAGEGFGSFILPARSELELFRLLPAADSLSLSWSERQVSFSVTFPDNFPLKRAFLLSKVVEGTYPNYQQVIPSGKAEWRVTLQRTAFLSALQRAALVNGGTAPAVRLRFSENLLEIFSSSAEIGDAYERVTTLSQSSEEVEISFNPKYLIDPLRALHCPEVFFEFRDPLSPGILRAGEDFLCVIMPLRSNI